MADVFDRAASHKSALTWPSQRWADDPVGFAREVLGIELWSAQVEIVESIRDNRNTTVRSGHKCGKSTALAVAALWFYCTFPRARVMLTAVKAKQIDEVLWKEVRRLYREAILPIDGTINMTARSGLSARDERQIWGVTARSGEGLAGISGPNVLILADEASGISDQFFEVLGSSLAGSGGTVRKCYISNPTRTTGEFYRSHTTNADLFHCIHISSEDTPNARGEGDIPGLAGAEWIAEKKIEYGVDSYAYAVRVRGEFVHDKDGKIVSLDLIATAQNDWVSGPGIGQVQLGIDCAGDKITGDESGFALRRGKRIKTVYAERALSEESIVVRAVDMIRAEHRPGDPTPRIAVDAEGGIGTRVVALLRVHLTKFPGEFVVVSVRAGHIKFGDPEYHLVRDALWGQTGKWLLAGGSIPDDVKLGQELNTPVFVEDENRRYRATPKKELRKLLGRSPDRADAVCLSVWGYASDEERAAAPPVPDAQPHARALQSPSYEDRAVNDPYAAASVWQGR